MRWLAIAATLTLIGCSNGRSGVATLYRNSSMDPGVRIHFGTFDADESNPNFNINNCQMTARLLNANIERLNGRPMPVGFWCEDDEFRAAGTVPTSFEAKFPVD